MGNKQQEIQVMGKAGYILSTSKQHYWNDENNIRKNTFSSKRHFNYCTLVPTHKVAWTFFMKKRLMISLLNGLSFSIDFLNVLREIPETLSSKVISYKNLYPTVVYLDSVLNALYCV